MATTLTLPTSSAPGASSGGDTGGSGGGNIGGGGGGSDLYTELGQTLQDAAASIDGGSSSGADGDLSQTDADTEPQSTELATQDTDTDGQEVVDAEFVDPNSPFQLSPDGKHYLVPKDQLADYTGLREYSTAVQERFPTVADAESSYMDSSDFRSIKYDYSSGAPESIDRMLSFWAGANAQDQRTRQRYESAFAVMAQRAPQLLARINPQAHAQLSKSLAQPIVSQAYERTAAISDPAQQKAAFLAAQGMDWVLNGSYKTELPKHDPQALATKQQREAEQNRLKDIETREARMLERDFKSFNQTMLDGPKIAAVWSEIDKTLAPVKNKYDDADYAELRTGVMKDLAAKLDQDIDWRTNHAQEFNDLRIEFQNCWKTGQDPAVLKQRAQYYVNDLLVRARRILPSIAAPRITKATGRAVIAAAPKPKNLAQNPPTQRTGNQSSPASGNAPGKNGNQQQSQQSGYYNVREDPDFGRMFKIA